MDALAKLQAEIAKKKKKDTTNTGEKNAGPAKKWKRKADIEAERKRQYLAEEAEFEEAQKAKRRKQQEARDALSARISKHGDDEVRTESEERTKNDQGDKAEETDETPKSTTDVQHDEKASTTVAASDSKADAKTAKVVKSEDDEDETPASVEQGPPNETDYCREDYVAACVKHYLSLWRQEVDAMKAEEKRTREGRAVVTAFSQTVSWLGHLQRLLSKRQLKKDVLDGLRNIFAAVRMREYARANQVYLEQLAIGNAPWPMGATMVGIHARAAREKISEHKIAHVMNDEQTRKYIQCVKRLITVAERHYLTGGVGADATEL